MKASGVSEELFKNLSFRADRQNIISSNIANRDTPGYKTKDLSFANELDKVNKNQLQMHVTNANHILPANQINSSAHKVYDVENLQVQNDGNNVSLDREMSEMAKNNMMFQAIQAAIKKDSLLFRSVIDASGKN
ncbi:flagellar basal body rod protein FlgB [Arcobacter sp. FWKO B]|uniref:flagellar basal body rod protein FlgB n=1 Tax=Arcobacter sp. FWKO B TaxID=2593672 RepID=UPI0018A3E803|nr:flagellar basal body rod protein FlgB [Arcobacter sp. FWKO B]QOG12024.1 flagellar basal body rod protein FlgB [Arcobacter sp. FWKO B]